MELLSLQKLFRLLTHSVNGKFQDPPGDKIISIKKHKLGQNKNRNPTEMLHPEFLQPMSTKKCRLTTKLFILPVTMNVIKIIQQYVSLILT